MKVIQQKTLYFKEGNSDKVYEVNLCDSGDDLFIVNFRYGRRESVLREETKTVFPVIYDEAIQIFETLILAKEKKGYSEFDEIPKSFPTSIAVILEVIILTAISLNSLS